MTRKFDFGEMVAVGMSDIMSSDDFNRIFKKSSVETKKVAKDEAEAAGGKCSCKCKDCDCAKGSVSCEECSCGCKKSFASSLENIINTLSKISSALDDMGLSAGAEETLNVLNGLVYEAQLLKSADYADLDTSDEELEVEEPLDDTESSEEDEIDDEALRHELQERIKELTGEELDLEEQELELGDHEEDHDHEEHDHEDHDHDEYETEEHAHEDENFALESRPILVCRFCKKEFPKFYKSRKGKTKSGWHLLMDHIMDDHPEESVKIRDWALETSPVRKNIYSEDVATPMSEEEEQFCSVSPEVMASLKELDNWIKESEETANLTKEASAEDELTKLTKLFEEYNLL